MACHFVLQDLCCKGLCAVRVFVLQDLCCKGLCAARSVLQGSSCCKICAARVFVLQDLCCKGLCAARHDLLGNGAVLLLWGVIVTINVFMTINHKCTQFVQCGFVQVFSSLSVSLLLIVKTQLFWFR